MFFFHEILMGFYPAICEAYGASTVAVLCQQGGTNRQILNLQVLWLQVDDGSAQSQKKLTLPSTDW